ncbi:hypothetical protein GOV06_03925 [Candidatus Woesearchaeota archaeon]|nr:hypothetical protein [Candidatus Woesearchaeota archaeon]
MTNPVLASLDYILQDNKFVFVDKDKIKEIAPEIAKQELPIPDWKFPHYIEETSTQTIDFFFLANSLNFSYTDFDTKEKYSRDNLSGSDAMWYSLKQAYLGRKPILNADYLANLTKAEVEEIFTGETPLPMLEQRTAILNQVGQVLSEKYNGRFLFLVGDSNNKAFDNGNGIVERLVRDFPSFNDISNYQGHELKFYKRAQLAVGMTYGRLKEIGLFEVDDIDSLTVFADYVLPVGLSELGIFQYEKSLQQRINSKQLIEKDSREEIELRANTIYAADLLIKEINKHRTEKINALNLDAKLWSESRKSRQPHHITKTIAY